MVDYLKKVKHLIPTHLPNLFNFTSIFSRPIQIGSSSTHKSPLVNLFINAA